MRLKCYINEGPSSDMGVVSRSKAIDHDTAVNDIKKYCKKSLQAFDKGHRIYRGVYEKPKTLVVEPSKTVRVSKNTNNLYTMIVDNSYKWAGYPKRSRSIICTNDAGYASGFGNLFHVFPVDGSSYGVCSDADFWSAFTATVAWRWLDEINNDVSGIMIDLGINHDVLKGSDYNKLKKALMDIDRKAKETGYTKEWMKGKKWYDAFEWIKGKYKGDFLAMMEEILDPDKNKFFHTKDPMKIPTGNDREIWTDGKSYLVMEDWMTQYKELLVP